MSPFLSKLSRLAFGSFATVILIFADPHVASAMPTFAQAYGMKCEVCHTQVPTLNAYGRYIQRTGYATLDSHTLRKESPFWIGETANYSHNSTDISSRTELGNFALHAAGALNDNVTFHLQQWVWQNGQAGGVDTVWLTFNNLFNRNGHLFVGKMPGTTASPLSQWTDLASFATPELTIGEHVYQNDGNRWGSKFIYVKNSLDAEIGYFAAGGDLGGIGVYTQDTEKTLQWRVAHANPEQPLEYGLMGSRGSLPLAAGGFDQYVSITPYLQRDPVGNMPGIFAMYHMAHEGNAGQDALGNPLGEARGNAATIELYKPLGSKALLAIRKEFQNDGLGSQTQSGNVDFAYHLMPFLHLYLETAMSQNATPTWKYMVWWTLPLQQKHGPAQSAAMIAPADNAVPSPGGVALPSKVAASATPVPAVGSPVKAVAGPTAVSIVASNWRFTPNTLTLHVGEATKLQLSSSSGVHGIESPALGIPLTVIQPGKITTITVTPKKTGTFVLHCAVTCGPGHEKMELTVTVL